MKEEYSGIELEIIYLGKTDVVICSPGDHQIED